MFRRRILHSKGCSKTMVSRVPLNPVAQSVGVVRTACLPGLETWSKAAGALGHATRLRGEGVLRVAVGGVQDQIQAAAGIPAQQRVGPQRGRKPARDATLLGECTVWPLSWALVLLAAA